MNPCVMCKKPYCPLKCKPKADYIRHMKKLNRKIRCNGNDRQIEKPKEASETADC